MSSGKLKGQPKLPTSNKNNTTTKPPAIAINPDAEEVLKNYGHEITKLLLSNTIDYVRTTSQQLQTVTSILLSSYIAIFFGLGKQFGLSKDVPTQVYAIPIVFFAASLITSFIIALRSKSSTSAPGDWISADKAFDENIYRRQRQMYLPAILSGIGLLSFVVIAIWFW